MKDCLGWERSNKALNNKWLLPNDLLLLLLYYVNGKLIIFIKKKKKKFCGKFS